MEVNDEYGQPEQDLTISKPASHSNLLTSDSFISVSGYELGVILRFQEPRKEYSCKCLVVWTKVTSFWQCSECELSIQNIRLRLRPLAASDEVLIRCQVFTYIPIKWWGAGFNTTNFTHILPTSRLFQNKNKVNILFIWFRENLFENKTVAFYHGHG